MEDNMQRVDGAESAGGGDDGDVAGMRPGMVHLRSTSPSTNFIDILFLNTS